MIIAPSLLACDFGKFAKETIRARLLACIPQVIANAGLSESIYCVALAYDGEGNDSLPPTIGVGLESERERSRQLEAMTPNRVAGGF